MSDATITAIATVLAALVAAAGAILAVMLQRRWDDNRSSRQPAAPPDRPAAPAAPLTPDEWDAHVAKVIVEIQKNEEAGDDCTVNDGSQKPT
jgi:hypothetical protein